MLLFKGKNVSTVSRFSYSNVIRAMKISIKDRAVLMTNSVLAQGSYSFDVIKFHDFP